MNAHDVVYVVDDDAASREAVVGLVREMGVEAHGYDSGEAMLEAYDGRRPACLVTDIRMLRMSGLELQEELQKRGYQMATVVLTGYAETAVTVRAIKNGAITLLEKPCKNLELWDAIRAALAHDAQQWRADSQRRDVHARLSKLTPSERQVLDLMLAGEANKVIANRLDVSVRTVEVRRQAIFNKMQADSVAKLVRMVVEAEEK